MPVALVVFVAVLLLVRLIILRGLGQWALMAAAVLDKLVHTVHVIIFKK